MFIFICFTHPGRRLLHWPDFSLSPNNIFASSKREHLVIVEDTKL